MKKLSLIALALLFSSACAGPKSVQTVPVAEQSGQQESQDIIAPSGVNPPSDDPDFENPYGDFASGNEGGGSASDGGSLPPEDVAENAPEEVPQDAPDGSVVSLDQTEFAKSGPLSKAPAGGVVLVDKPKSTSAETSVSNRIHVFSLVQDGGGYFSKPHFLYHVTVGKNHKGALWGSDHTGEYIPAPYEGDDLLDLNESPAVTRTKNGVHIVSRSGDKIVYWECSDKLLDPSALEGDEARGKAFCKSKVINGGDNLKVQGCVAITSDPYGRVYIFAKHNPSGRLEIFQGTGLQDMHSAGYIFSGADVQSCPAAAYHPAMKRVYVFSSHDGDLFAGFSDKISDAGSKVSFYEGAMTAARKFNGGMASCGENGRLTTVYNTTTKKMSVLHHEKGGSNTAIQSFGFEDEQTGFKSSTPILQKQLSQATDDSDNIDDYPVGVYDELGVPHVFADKAYANAFYGAEKTASSVQSYQVTDDEVQVERAPAAVFDPELKVIHLFGRRWVEPALFGYSNHTLTHFVKKRRPDGSWSPWKAELLVDDGNHDFEGCPAALIEN